MISHGTAIPVAAGATSKVFRAWDEARGEWIAIKQLVHADPGTRARLMREARAAARLSHPHICPVLDVGEREGRPVIVMPFLDGRTLGEAARELPVEAVLRLVAQVADAVHHAHEHGLLHRDLKPDNVIVTDADGLPHAWVLDFGLVREIGAPGATATGQVLGTPAFMSPEQARGEADLDRRSDVFSLGATLFAALTGEAPFAGTSTADTLMRVMQQEPPRLRSLRRGLDLALEAIVATALAKSPQRRYSSARAFADDLRRHLSGERVQARITATDRVRRAYRRQPLLLALGTAAVIAGAAVLAVGWQLSREADARERVAADAAADAERARQQLRMAYLQPAHDLTATLRGTEATVASLLERSSGLGAHVRARSLHAAAQLRSEAGDDDGAIALLERAPGDNIAIAAALAHARIRAWRAALARPQPHADPALRKRLRDDAERRYLAPARDALASMSASTSTDWLLAAEMRASDGDIDAALADIDTGLAREPSRYDALRVAAELRMVRGLASAWRSDAQAASDDYAAADALLERALDYGRSDPRVHRRRCQLAGLYVAALAERHDPDTALPDSDAPCRVALAVNPADATLHAALAHLQSARAKAARRTGDDAAALLDEAVGAAETGLRIAPGDPRLTQELALALTRRSTALRWAGRTDPAPTARALEALAAARAAGDDDSGIDLDLVTGQVYGEHAQVLEQLGDDGDASFEAAIAHLRTAVERVPDAAFLRLNLANALSTFQFHRALRGRPDPGLSEAAIAQLERAAELQPERASIPASLALAHWDLAMARSWRGESMDDAVARADALFDRAQALDPDSMTTAYNRYGFELFVAAERQRDGVPAGERIDRAQALADTMDARSEDWLSPCPRAELALRRVQHAALGGRFDDAEHARAQKLLDAGLAAQPEDTDCARRHIELAALAMPWLPDTAARDAFADAASLAARHAQVLDVQLAHLGLLRAADATGVAEDADRTRADTLLASLRKATGDAWRARLRPFEPADATLTAR